MAGEERSVKVKIDNVRRVFNTRNGEMIALNGVSLDIMEKERYVRPEFKRNQRQRSGRYCHEIHQDGSAGGFR